MHDIIVLIIRKNIIHYRSKNKPKKRKSVLGSIHDSYYKLWKTKYYMSDPKTVV